MRRPLENMSNVSTRITSIAEGEKLSSIYS